MNTGRGRREFFFFTEPERNERKQNKINNLKVAEEEKCEKIGNFFCTFSMFFSFKRQNEK